MIKGALKVLDQALAPFHPRIRTLNGPSSRNWDKARLPFRCVLSFCRFGSELEANFGHDLRVEQFERHLKRVRMIPVVKQNRDFWNVHGLGTKVIQVINQHLNQALVIGDIRFRTVGEERQS